MKEEISIIDEHRHLFDNFRKQLDRVNLHHVYEYMDLNNFGRIVAIPKMPFLKFITGF